MIKFPSHKLNKGIGLVELLVALVISSLVVLMVVKSYGNNKETYISHETVTRIQENGRYALQLLARDIRSTDFWGCNPTREALNEVFVGVETNLTPAASYFADGILGVDASGSPQAGFPTGTDSITIAGVQAALSFPLAARAEKDDPIRLNVGTSTNIGISAGDLIVLSDCKKAEVVQITAVGPITAGEVDLQHSTTPPSGATVANASASLKYSYDENMASLYRGVRAITYDIANDPITNLLSLRRNGVVIVPGVENMQLRYGEDDDNDNVVDRYVTAAGIGDPEDIISIQISLLVRSTTARNTVRTGYTLAGETVVEADVPADANGLFPSRRVYTATVTLRNRSA